MTQNYGAYPTDWQTFIKLNLTADLLPVVSKPGTTISDKSFMKSVGKTPSVYNKNGDVVGLPEWTQRVTPEVLALQWSTNPDYGICLQTRYVRALDIDVDGELANTIANTVDEMIYKMLGEYPAKRTRSNSTKCLLAFKIKGDMPKRVFKTRSGIVEFLANGQQFVASGTHIKDNKATGSRYEWEGGIENVYFPEITLEQFELIWAEITKHAVEKPSEGSIRRERGGDIQLFDPIVDQLPIIGWGRDGQAFIECPWKSEHTVDSGPSETSYFPRGTRGYEQGHFKCLHAHCSKRTDTDFLDAFGLRMAGIEILEVDEKTGEKLPPEPPRFRRNGKGEIEPVLFNLESALGAEEWLGWDIRFDSFRDEIMTKGPMDMKWRPFTDEDMWEVKLMLEKKAFKNIPIELIRGAIRMMAGRRKFDSAQIWLKPLEWDGKPRIANFCHDYFGSEDTPYTRAVSRYMWSAMAGRVMEPGVQADMAVILQGEQGLGKSSAIAALVPHRELFVAINLNDKFTEISRLLRGKLVGELGEMAGFYNKEFEQIKGFITQRSEEWIPKYKEFAHVAPRRCVFFGTTNKERFLIDETGNRRFLPIVVYNPKPDLIARDRLQLWAEARELFHAEGVCWKDADRLCRSEHDKFMIEDTWGDILAEWLGMHNDQSGKTVNGDRKDLTNQTIFSEVFGMMPKQVEHKHEFRLGKVMKMLNYVKVNGRVEGSVRKIWVKKGSV